MNYVEPIRDKKNIIKIENYLIKVNKSYALIFILGINTGLRISDILSLRVSDVKNKIDVNIKEKKTGKLKRFPLNIKLQKLLYEYLNEYENQNDANLLFIGNRGSRINRSTVYRFINKAVDVLNINVGAVGTHTMRKTFGYHHYKMFNDIALLQKILNHSSPSITLRYIGITQEEIDNSYKNFILWAC